jgi:hypothetical protein
VVVEVDDPRVDVAGAADGRGVAELVRDLLDDLGDGPLARRRALGVGRDGQADRRHDGRRPGAEVLGGVVAAGDGAQVVVDVAALHVDPRRSAPGPAAVGEQLGPAAAALSELLDDARDLGLDERALPELAALAGELEADLEVAEVLVVTVTCSLSSVARPYDWFSEAYCSPPMRKKPRSSSRTAHASTRVRVSPRW